MRGIHLLPSRHQGHFSVTMEFWGTDLSFLFLCYQSRGTSLPAPPNPPLSCISRGVPFNYPSQVVLTSPVPFLGRDITAKVGTCIYFASPIHLTACSLAVPAFSFSKPHNLTHPFHYQLPKWLPGVGHPNSSIARHRSPLIRFQNPSLPCRAKGKKT